AGAGRDGRGAAGAAGPAAAPEEAGPGAGADAPAGVHQDDQEAGGQVMVAGSFSIAIWAALSVAGATPPPARRAVPLPAPPPPSLAAPGARPWEKVTPEQEQAAKTLFEQGNRELLEYRFEDAARDYRDALGHWDLPAIHYNLAVALRSLNDLLEAREHLETAVKYGPE